MADRRRVRQVLGELTNLPRQQPGDKPTTSGLPNPTVTVTGVATRSRRDDSLEERRRASSMLLAPPQPTAFPSPGADSARQQDPLHVSEYVKSIFERLRAMESQTHCHGYLGLPGGTQPDINARMRAILVDWQVQMHQNFRLLPETLFLAVNILDRFLSKKSVNREKLQLVGAVSLLLAAKYEEVYPPDMRDIARLVARSYHHTELVSMERIMLLSLDFVLTVPTPFAFLKRLIHVLSMDGRLEMGARYLAELSLLHHDMLAYPPSVVAASSVYLSRELLGEREPWGHVGEYYSSLTAGALEGCVKQLREIVAAAPTQSYQAIRRKYSHTKYREVAQHMESALKQGE